MIAASIIIPCFNQLEFTRHCLRAVFRHTRPPFELIAIDNGSTDGTGVYLAGVQDSSPAPVTVISNARNIGFPAAVNQGLKVARGQYLVLLNNDAVVTDAWLEQLIGLAEMKTDLTTEGTEGEGTTNQTNLTNQGKRIGLVGPMSNYAPPPQWVENVPYKGLEELEGFARRWREEHRGQWFTTGKLSGFCLLVKRIVYETIGGSAPAGSDRLSIYIAPLRGHAPLRGQTAFQFTSRPCGVTRPCGVRPPFNLHWGDETGSEKGPEGKRGHLWEVKRGHL